ncbi:MAG: helix-turn-helix domain-containing protein [Candidatus Methanofastidiosia archaeon]
MKRVTLELSRESLKNIGMGGLEEFISRIEFLNSFKLTGEGFTEVCKVKLEMGVEKDSLIGKFGVSEIDILSEDKGMREFLCVIKGKVSPFFKTLIENFDCFFVPPTIIGKDLNLLSIACNQKEIEEILKFFKENEINYQIKSVGTYIFDAKDLLRLLTEKQRKALFFAYENGLFEKPRKSDTRKVARKLGISHTTFIHHLRRAEKKIFSEILKGFC